MNRALSMPTRPETRIETLLYAASNAIWISLAKALKFLDEAEQLCRSRCRLNSELQRFREAYTPEYFQYLQQRFPPPVPESIRRLQEDPEHTVFPEKSR